MQIGKRAMFAMASALHLSMATAGVVTLQLDGLWSDFAVGAVGDVWRSPLGGEAITFSVTSASAFTLRVVDVGFAGDQVQVVSGGNQVLGMTSSVPVDDTVFAFTPDEAFLSPGTWGQGRWSLAAGNYTFGGTATESPFGGAAWAISALADTSNNVPEPGGMVLALTSLALLAATARKRR